MADFVEKLKELGFDFFVGVPCSFFKSAIDYIIDDPEIEYRLASNEGIALAMASGAYLAGRFPVVILQNSGFGNLVNPMTSLSMIYKIPVLLLISGRGYKVDDQPQHHVMGTRMTEILEGMGLGFREMPKDEKGISIALEQSAEYLLEHKQLFALIVQKGTLSDYLSHSDVSDSESIMTRFRAIEIITDQMDGDEVVISTTGHTSRLLFVVNDNPQNFYMQGSMGHAVSIGLGIALSQPKRKVVIIDGDGAILMHMGALSTVGYYRPKNMIHLVLDNEAYESTGGQVTSSSTTDLVGVARSCGYQTVANVGSKQHLKTFMRDALKSEDGPYFARIKVFHGDSPIELPRIPEKYSVDETCRIVRNFLRSD